MKWGGKCFGVLANTQKAEQFKKNAFFNAVGFALKAVFVLKISFLQKASQAQPLSKVVS